MTFTFELEQDRVAPIIYNIVGSTEIARPEGPKSEARTAERDGVLGEGTFPSPLAMGSSGGTL